MPRQMGPAGRLSDGGAELRGGALGTRQENGARPAAPAAEVSRDLKPSSPDERNCAHPGMTGKAGISGAEQFCPCRAIAADQIKIFRDLLGPPHSVTLHFIGGFT